MKIKFSLRIYFFSAVIILGLGLGMLAFGFIGNYFVSGLDNVIQASMLEVADQLDPEEGKSKTLMGFIITRRWQDMPQIIQKSISKPKSDEQLVKQEIKKVPGEPPGNKYFSALVVDKFGNKEYVVRVFGNTLHERLAVTPETQFAGIMTLALIATLAFITIMFLMMRSVIVPVDKLSGWTKKLSENNLQESPPNFHYTELNDFAELIRSGLLTTQQSLEREKVFLRHASHELRTPIAVIKNSAELLERIPAENPQKQTEVIQRIKRASLTMKNLIETLLWMGQQPPSNLPLEKVKLDEVIQQLNKDLAYLLKGKPEIETVCQTTHHEMELPAEACRIIISNLMRNAFQHTQSGQIRIEQSASRLCITNPVQIDGEDEDRALGFGLGLHLCNQLSDRFGWKLEHQTIQGEHRAIIYFR